MLRSSLTCHSLFFSLISFHPSEYSLSPFIFISLGFLNPGLCSHKYTFQSFSVFSLFNFGLAEYTTPPESIIIVEFSAHINFSDDIKPLYSLCPAPSQVQPGANKAVEVSEECSTPIFVLYSPPP